MSENSKKKHNLPVITEGKKLYLWDKTRFKKRMIYINTTLYSLMKMHCENEGIYIRDYMARLIIEDLKKAGQLKCSLNQTKRVMTPAQKKEHRKKMRSIGKARRNVERKRGLRKLWRRKRADLKYEREMRDKRDIEQARIYGEDG